MTTKVYAPQNQRDHSRATVKAGILSVFLHVFIFMLVVYGAPYMPQKKLTEYNAIAVEIISLPDAAEIAEPPTTDIAQKIEPKKPLVEPAKPKPVIEDREEPAPKPIVEDVAALVPELKDDEDVVLEVEEVAKAPPPKPTTKPKPPQVKPRVKDITPPEDKPEPVAPPSEARGFDDILNDFKAANVTEKTSAEPHSTVTHSDVNLSSFEKNALEAGIIPCWSVDAGMLNAGDMLVSVRAYINPDLSVSRVEILGDSRDPRYLAAANAARAALLNKKCNTLNLPIEKYEPTKIFTFDPSKMF